jgi:hypothetical protein
LAAVGIVLAIVLVVYGPALLTGQALAGEDIVYANPPFSAERPPGYEGESHQLLGDPVFAYHPLLLFDREELRSGELPLWNPYVATGRPLGAGQGAPFFPLNWLSFLLPFWQSLAWVAAAKLAVAALGMFAFCRGLGLRAAAATLGGIAFAFGTYLLVLLDAGQMIALGVSPWALWLVDRLLAHGRLLDALGLGLAAGLIMLNGHPESAALTLLFVAAYAAYRSLQRHRGEGLPARIGPLLGLSGVVAIAVGAVAIVSTLEVLTQGESTSRGGGDRSLSLLTGLFFPNWLGRPDEVAFGSASDFADRAMYVGAIPLALAIAGFSLRRSGAQVFFGASAVLALLLATDSPLRDLVELLPGATVVELGHLQGIAVLAIATLSAFGLDRLLASSGAERRRLLARLAAVAAVPLLALVAVANPLGAVGDALRPGALLGNEAASLDAARLAAILRWAVLVGTLCALAIAARSSPRWPLVIAVVAVGASAIDLALIDRGYRPAIDVEVADPPAPASIRLMQANAPHDRIAADGPSLFPNLAVRYGLRDVRGEDLPALQRYVDLFTALGGTYTDDFGSTTLDPPPRRRSRLLEVFAVRYLLAGPDQGAPPQGYSAAAAMPGQLPFESKQRRRRAELVHDWSPAASADDALAAVAATEPRRSRPVIEGADPPGDPVRAPASARIVADEPRRVEIRTESRAAGYLVLRDAHYPGWSAEVDGERAEILPADVAFRAVRVPAGRHLVRFAYRPPYLIAAAATTGVAMLGSVLAIILLAWRGRRADARGGG